MNCGTFQLQRIARAVEEVMKTFEAKYCASCQSPLVNLNIVRSPKGEGYACPNCDEKVCVICGCTDNHACTGGCSWLGPGICSTHSTELDEALARNGIHVRY